LNITENLTMLHSPQTTPYRFFNLGALLGSVTTLAFIAFCMLYFPALLALPMGIGWLGLVGVVSVGAAVLADNYHQTRAVTSASAVLFSAVAFAASAFALHMAPAFVTSGLSIISVSLIGSVIGSGIYECIKSGWRNFFSSTIQSLTPDSPNAPVTTRGRQSSTHTVNFELGALEGYNLETDGDRYQEIASPDGLDDSDENGLIGAQSTPASPELKLQRCAPHAGARPSKLLLMTTPVPVMSEGDDGVLTNDSNESTDTLGSSSQRAVR
jgi:hypothetical protein